LHCHIFIFIIDITLLLFAAGAMRKRHMRDAASGLRHAAAATPCLIVLP
jgi:hypothetical protein